jgi:TRAP-type C4-dicarboxylate transport system permease small subunit
MAVETYQPRNYWEQRGLALLWFAVLAGPVAVAVNQFAGYVLVKWACASGHTYVLTAIDIAMLGLALAGAWVGWTCRERLRDATEFGGRIIDRSYFVAIVAIGLALITAFLIVMQTYPHFILSPCE